MDIVGTVVGVSVLVGCVWMWWYSTPPEPLENVEARKRYGKISKEEINAMVKKNNI